MKKVQCRFVRGVFVGAVGGRRGLVGILWERGHGRTDYDHLMVHGCTAARAIVLLTVSGYPAA